MGLKEILAAKKAAAEAAAKAANPETKVEDAPNNPDSPVVESPVLATPVSALDYEAGTPESANPPASDKPLTFAEKMALKKAGVVAAQAVPQAPSKQLGPVEIDPAMIPENEADAQAYVDIKTKIHNLEAMFDDDLKNAMSELKQALKKNPNATDLMLDADVGKMVTALRRMTHVAQVEATTKTKAGKTKTAVKLKDAPLTKEEIEAAFNDL